MRKLTKEETFTLFDAGCTVNMTATVSETTTVLNKLGQILGETSCMNVLEYWNNTQKIREF